MIEFRCCKCNKLLFKGQYRGTIQIMCSRCKIINEINIESKKSIENT